MAAALTPLPNTPEAPATQAAVPVAAPAKPLTFFQRLKLKIAAVVKEVFADEPKFEAIAISTLTVVTPLAGTLLDELDPAAASEFNGVVSAIQTDLTALTLVIKDGGPTPTILSFIESIKTNLGAIVTGVGVKSPASVAKVTGITTTIANELEAIAAELPAA